MVSDAEFDALLKKLASLSKKGNNVLYYVYHANKKEMGLDASLMIPDIEPIDKEPYKQIGACFSSLVYILNNHTTFNRVLYVPDCTYLDKKDIVEWIELCIDNDALPQYLRGKYDLKKGFVLNTKIPKSLLYSYSCNIRFVDEETELVTAVLFLVKKCNIPFAVALQRASECLCTNGGHNYVSCVSAGIS